MASASAGSRDHSATWCFAQSAIASALPQAPAPSMAIFIPAWLRLSGSEAPDLAHLEETDLAVGVTHLDPAAARGVDHVQSNALLRLEYERSLVVRRLPDVGKRRGDHDRTLVGKGLLFHPGQIAGLIPHLHPGIDVDDDLDGIAAGRDEELLRPNRRPV